MLKMIASSVHQFPQNKYLTSIGLLHLLKSYGSRIKSIEKFNHILNTKCSQIQSLIYQKINVCNNYYNIHIYTIPQ